MTWMRTSARASLIGAIVCEVAATLSLKGALTSPWLIAVVVLGYGGAFWLLALTLRRGMGVGVAYGIWGACGVVLTAALSMVLFGESMTPLMLLGMGLIIVGVGLVEFGSHPPGQRGRAADSPVERDGGAARDAADAPGEA